MERTDFEQWKAKEVARLLALVETERRYYQEIVASLPVALVVLGPDRSILSANRSFRQTFGLRGEDMRRKTIEQILPSPELVESIRQAHVGSGGPSSALIQIEGRRFRIAAVPIRNWDEEGDLETLLMVEEASAAEFTRPQASGAAPAPHLEIPAVIWKADPRTFAFTSVAGAAEELLGYPAAHWVSTAQFFRERIHPEDRAATMAFYEAAVGRQGDASTEFRAVAASGAVLWCRETIRNSDRGLSGVLTDISLRKQLEREMLAAERTEALRAAASRLAHDLNNPLMIITGYGEELLQSLPANESARADVAQIMTATERISGITAQLLNFTRRVAEPAKPVDLNALLARLEEKIPGNDRVSVEIDPASEPVWAMADASQLEDILQALASPAREEARERSRLSISCGVEAIAEQIPGAPLAPGAYARITIRDDGRGTDSPKSVFEAAVLGKDPSASRAYAIVREWGGDLAFSSEPFRGSTFTIYLPLSQAAPAAAAVAPPEPPPPEPPRMPTILLVEDEPGIRALVRKILRREHFVVIEAGSGEEALNVAAAQEGRIDLLVTDVILPGINGRELAERMRESLPELKVLYVSGFTSDESVRAGAFPPGAKFLQKPFTLSALVGKVREALAD
ncbi:MAG TPA: response regulator [Bryobacteraceae bacterium]|jgi:two-component system cell cycle sensor histidine kinase/response regulator CckA|nr:response regulator [Bryobacteraceae bacterium]